VKPKANVNVTALLAGVTALFGVIGALAATGLVGRLERNEPEALIAAVLIVLLGSAMLVIAGLPITTDRSELFALLVGTGLTVVGIGWAVAAGITDAGRSERPQLDVSVDAKESLVKGSVKAANLASHRTLVVLVEGLKPSKEGGKNWEVATLAQFYVGPDSEGKVDMPLGVIVPANGYTSVGIKAKTSDTETCSQYPRRGGDEVFKDQIDEAGAGCAVLPLPAQKEETKGAATGKPKAKVVWKGSRRSSGRLRLQVTASGGGDRVAVLVAGLRRGRIRQVLRSVNPIGKDGSYSAPVAVLVGPGFRRLCARVEVLAAGEPAHRRLPNCPLPRAPRIGAAGAELRLKRP
jgi:hypothetical protein